MEDVQRLLRTPGDHLPFPDALAQRLINDLPPPPTRQKDRNSIDWRQERYENYPSRAADIMSVCIFTKSQNLSLLGGKVLLKGVALRPALPEVATCFVQFVREKPFAHCYQEHVVFCDLEVNDHA